ncbi:MAG: alpha/beta fold hydrolase [Planctomycetota bacterium]|nr:alpha/beta fold hydrolase [Planctomycetota bacterium]
MITKTIYVSKGNSLNCVDTGAGEALLFVHGFPLDHSMWRSQLEYFSRDYRCIAPDLRGFGGSPATAGSVSMSDYADDLALLLGHLGVEGSVTVCGLSMGGYIAWEFWMRHRHWVRKLVLCDTKATADSAEVARARQLMATEILQGGTSIVVDRLLPKLFSPATDPTRIRSWVEPILKADRVGIAAAQCGMAGRCDMTARLGEIDVPSLVVVGEHDTITTPQEMEQMSRQMPHARCLSIPLAGHLAPWEQPAAFNEALAAFLAEN